MKQQRVMNISRDPDEKLSEKRETDGRDLLFVVVFRSIRERQMTMDKCVVANPLVTR